VLFGGVFLVPTAQDRLRMGQEIDMADAEKAVVSEGAAAGPAPSEVVEKKSVSDRLKENVSLLEKFVKMKETRGGQGRLLRQTAASRKELTPEALIAFVKETLPEGLSTRSQLLTLLSQVRLDIRE
jgi:hypothetical protein